MEKRRERILQQARKMLAGGGLDALNLRDLAQVSGITVPTIYNLIGNKSEVLKAVVMGAFAAFEAELESKLPRPAADMPNLMATTLTAIIAKDEDAYRATALAGDRLENNPLDPHDCGFKHAPMRQYATMMCHNALDEGLLRGKIDIDVLVDLMISNHQMAFRDWAHRVISLEELGKKSLRGFYIALAADATEDYRDSVVAKQKEL